MNTLSLALGQKTEPAPAPEPAPSAPVEPADAPAEPVPAAPVKPAPAAAVPGGVPKDGPVERGVWKKIIGEAERSFGPMRGMLTESSALIRGNTLVVTLARPQMYGEEMYINVLSPVVKTYLHRDYDIRLN